jgi:hypothetical protein
MALDRHGSHRRGIGRRSRRSRPRRSFRLDGLESQRLADRVLPTLMVTNFPIPLVDLAEPQGITTPWELLWRLLVRRAGSRHGIARVCRIDRSNVKPTSVGSDEWHVDSCKWFRGYRIGKSQATRL